MKVSKSIEDFDKKVLKLREDKKAKWKQDLLKNSGRSLEHLNKVKQTNKEKTDEKINSTLSELERRDELARQVFEENEAQRSRRRAIKDVRQQSFELAAIRRKKALDFRKQKLEESIRSKDERYQAIKDGEKALKRMTESITEVISKTKMELTCQMDRLNSKDMLTTENVVSKVHEHNDTVLFPRLKNRFSHLEGEDGPANDTQSARASTAGTTQSGTTGGGEEPSAQQQEEHQQEQSLDAADKALASTLPAPVSKPMSQSRPGTGSLNKTTKTVSLRPKSPTTNLGLKVLSKNKINDTLSMMKLTLEETAAAKEAGGNKGTPKKKPPREAAANKQKKDGDPLNLSGKQKPWLNGDDDHQEIVLDQQDEEFVDDRGGASAASSLEDDHLQPLSKSGSSSGLMRKNTPFPEDLKPKGKAERKAPVPNEDALFDELEEVEVDEEDIVARIEGTPKKKDKTRPQTISARPLTPDGKFRPEYSRDHPLAGGKGKYSKESQQGKQKLVPGKRREPPAPERLAEVMSKQEQKKYDLQRQLEDLRKHQNEALLEVLEDERQAEEHRTEMGRGVSDTKERNRLELIFTEERKRASERIIAMTKDHEQKMKQVIVAMDLGS